MADNPADKLAKGITRSATPAGMFEKMGDKFDPAPMLQLLQRMLGGQERQAPPIDAPLPRFGGLDERGQPIIIPPPGQARNAMSMPANSAAGERSIFDRMIQK